MKSLIRTIYRVYCQVALIGFSLLTVIVGWQVFARYVLHDTPSWSEPLSMLLLLYAVLLGTAVGVRDDFHLSLTWFKSRFTDDMQARLTIVEYCLVGAFGTAMAWYGLRMAARTWDYMIPGLAVPMGAQYLALVASGAAIALFALEKLFLKGPR